MASKRAQVQGASMFAIQGYSLRNAVVELFPEPSKLKTDNFDLSIKQFCKPEFISKVDYFIEF